LPLDGLPSEVFHFCALQFFNDCCGLASAITCNLRQPSCIARQAVVLYGLTILRDLHP
jgi:hypothetical protein